MKKLTVLLAAVMAFAFSANAYAANFSDISEQPVKVQDAIAKTVALGIINGYEDGTFGPEQNITRAEFSKIAVTAAGAKDTADMLANNASSFKDVKAGQWYTGWVNASESLGIFQGDGNGNFRPNDTITNQEVITVLMRLLGYNDNLTGTWPVNYVTQANKSEILDDVAVVASAAAKRGDVVVMLDATLDTDLVTYDKDTNEFVAKQTGIGTSTVTGISLLQDSFKGSYVDVTGYTVDGNKTINGVKTFNGVNQIKDADKGTLTWTVNGGTTVIIDDETRVSYNGGSLFDLAGHQGKVYYVKDNDKLYARFIDVESYTKTSTATPAVDTDGKLVVNNGKIQMDKTNYNAASYVYDNKVDTDNDNKADKNSNYVMYFNDDDQVYAVVSDKNYSTQKVSLVKSVNSSTVKLVGATKDKTINLSDDVLVYTEDGFITPDKLEVGDAVKFVANDLYVKVDVATGTLTKAGITKSGTTKTINQLTIGGKSYEATGVKVLDQEMENADASIDDIYGNEVQFVLNNDNTVAVVVIDEVTNGTKLYGIVMGSANGGGWGNAGTSSDIQIFTEEGKTVTYDLDGVTFNQNDLGKLVEYKLNSDGEIKSANVNTNGVDLLTDSKSAKIEVKNNAYLVYGKNSDTVSLASNVVVFEVDNDDDDVDVNIATRSSVLAQDDFKPTDVYQKTLDSNSQQVKLVGAYAYGFTNTNGALRALAYTDAANTTYYYGVVAAEIQESADHDNALVLLDDENEYELKTPIVNSHTIAKNDLIIYTKSSDNVTVKWVSSNKSGLKNDSVVKGAEVKTYVDGVITFETDKATAYSFCPSGTDIDDPLSANGNTKDFSNVMTNDDTIVFVQGSDGKYTYGSTEDITAGDFIYVIVADEDDYADVVVVAHNDYK